MLVIPVQAQKLAVESLRSRELAEIMGHLSFLEIVSVICEGEASRVEVGWQPSAHDSEGIEREGCCYRMSMAFAAIVVLAESD